MLPYLFEIRYFMKKIIIIVNPSQASNNNCIKKNEELILSFKYFQNYLEFLKEYPKFQNILTNLPIFITLNNITDLDFENIVTNDLYFDVTNLPFLDLKFLLPFLKNKENCFFLTKYDNYKYASKQELINSLMKINQMLDGFIGLNPAEICFCLYDLIRTRNYIKYDEVNFSDNGYSRDLCQILNYKYIVCLGYANLFACLLEQLGIKNEILLWENKKRNTRHASNLVYVNDSKYNIHGIYTFDITFDRINNFQIPIEKYRWFFIPIYFDLVYRKHCNTLPTSFGTCQDIVLKAKHLNETNSQDYPSVIAQINSIRSQIGLNKVNTNLTYDQLKNVLNNLLWGPIIDEKTFKSLITNCRAYEKIFNAPLFHLNNDSMEKIINSNLVYQEFMQRKRTN